MAIDELLDEREQGERVKAWLRDNSLGLIGGLVLGAVVIFGWQFWKQRTHAQAVEQNIAYESTLRDMLGGDLDKAAQRVADLPDGAYGELAALQLAKAQLDAAEARVELARLALDHLTLRAPFAGRIIATPFVAGQYVLKGTVIAELADVTILKALAPVDRRAAKVGDETSVFIEDQQQSAKIQTIVPLPVDEDAPDDGDGDGG